MLERGLGWDMVGMEVGDGGFEEWKGVCGVELK